MSYFLTSNSSNSTQQFRFKSLLAFAMIFYGGLSTIKAVNAQLQLASYFDSNAREALETPESTYGLKLRGRLNHGLTFSKMNIYGGLLTQTYLDAVYKDESKLIVNSELELRYRWTQWLHLLGEMNHFQKSFYQHARSYLWTEYSTFLQFYPAGLFTAWIGLNYLSTTHTIPDQIRFSDKNFEFKGRYKFNRRIFGEGTLSRSTIVHKDYPAVNDSLAKLDYLQRDKGLKGFIHIRYQGKVISGIQLGFVSVKSNSVIGAYDQLSARIYFSGHWGNSTFYHFVFQRVNKDYQTPDLGGVSGYRDPEEPIQNRTYIRLEQVLKGGSTGYLQVSLLQNETILNRKYYDKSVVEAGLKFKL